MPFKLEAEVSSRSVEYTNALRHYFFADSITGDYGDSVSLQNSPDCIEFYSARTRDHILSSTLRAAVQPCSRKH